MEYSTENCMCFLIFDICMSLIFYFSYVPVYIIGQDVSAMNGV